MSTTSDVQQLVTDLDHGLGDDTRIDQEFLEIIDILARKGWWTEATLVEMTPATSDYSKPSNALDIITAFYDDEELAEETKRSLEAYSGPAWRDAIGRPLSFIIEDLDNGTFRLFPTPSLDSKSFVFALGAPFGIGYPEYSAVVVTTIKQPITFQIWLYMPAALLICGLEFSREGRNKSDEFSQSCQAVFELAMEFLN